MHWIYDQKASVSPINILNVKNTSKVLNKMDLN